MAFLMEKIKSVIYYLGMSRVRCEKGQQTICELKFTYKT